MDEFTDKIRRLRAELNVTQVGLGKFLGVHQSTASRWLKGVEPREHDERIRVLDLIAEFDEARGITRSEAQESGELHDGTVPVDGYVSAGEGRFESFKSGRSIRANAPPGTRALEIRGESLGVTMEGWYALYNEQFEPYTRDMLGSLCIVETDDGRRLVKTLLKGTGDETVHLQSGTGKIEFDVRVVRAARVLGLVPG